MIGRVLHHLKTLVACDTQNPPRRINGADRIFQYLAERLSDRGFTVETRDLDEGCVWLLARRGNPGLLFNFHVDTVPVGGGAGSAWTGDPLALRVEGENAIARGACDVKGAAACMLTAAEGTSRDAALLFTSDEEAGNDRCVRDFLDRRHDYRGVIVGEPTSNRAILAHRGLATCGAVFRGIPGHGSSPRALPDSALHESIRWAAAALRFAGEEESRAIGGLSGIRFNLGTLSGGTKANMIAERAELRFGVRPRPGEDPAALLAALAALAPDAPRATFTPAFTGLPLPPPGQAPDAARDLAARLGLPIGPPVDFWSEAPLFAAAGYPSLVYGPGSIAQAHATDEHVPLADLSEAAAAYARILEIPR